MRSESSGTRIGMAAGPSRVVFPIRYQDYQGNGGGDYLLYVQLERLP